MSETLLRFDAVRAATGLSRSAIYRLLEANAFPKPITITGTRTKAWPASSVTSWVEAQIAANQN